MHARLRFCLATLLIGSLVATASAESTLERARRTGELLTHRPREGSHRIEHAEIERVGPNPDDSGDIETLPDGTVSIPVLEEQLVIEKRLVVTERLLVRKRVEVKEQRVTADLTREVVTVDSDEAVDERVHVQEG